MASFAKVLAPFQKWDKTGSGKIGLDEMQAILASAYRGPPAVVERVLAIYNADSSHVLCYADFLMWLYDGDGSQEAAASVPVGVREKEEEDGAPALAPDDMNTSKKAAASVPVEEREEEMEGETAPALAPDDTDTWKAAASVPVEEREDEKEERAPAPAPDDTNTSKAAASVPVEEREEEEKEETAPAPKSAASVPMEKREEEEKEAAPAPAPDDMNTSKAVKHDGRALEHCSEKLRNDKEVAMEAVEKRGLALEFCSEELRSHRDVVMEALKRCKPRDVRGVFRSLSKELRNSKELAIEGVKQYGGALKFCSEELRGDRDVVMEAVKQHGGALEFCSEELRGDRDVVMEALKQNGRALEFCSEELRSDRDVVMEALKTRLDVFTYFSADDWNDKQFVIEAVKRNGEALQFCSQELRGDKEVVMEAARNSATAMKFALKGMNQDPQCLKVAGLMRESGATEKRSEKGIFSVKFGLTAGASNLSTVVADLLATHPEMSKFEIYNPNLYCKKSCDPNYTDLTWPCRGTETTCTREQQKITTDAHGMPTKDSCWRLSFRLRQKMCKETGGFMLQLEEYGELGKGQEIETRMANELHLKIFRIIWKEKEFWLGRADVKKSLANQIADAVLDWFADEKSDSEIEFIKARLFYKSKRFATPCFA